MTTAATALLGWLRRAVEGGNTPMFVRTVLEAAPMACLPDCALLGLVPLELRRRYPAG